MAVPGLGPVPLFLYSVYGRDDYGLLRLSRLLVKRPTVIRGEGNFPKESLLQGIWFILVRRVSFDLLVDRTEVEALDLTVSSGSSPRTYARAYSIAAV